MALSLFPHKSKGDSHAPMLGKGPGRRRALIMSAFMLWNTLIKSSYILNYTLQLWPFERIRISPLWPRKRSPKYVPTGSRTEVRGTAPQAVHKSRCKTSCKAEITMKQHLQIHTIRSTCYIKKKKIMSMESAESSSAANPSWSSQAMDGRDLIRNTVNVTFQVKYFKPFSPREILSSREAAEAAVNDTWCSNGSWKPISASWECVFVHRSWVGAFLQSNVFFDSNVSMELKSFPPGRLQCVWL